MLYIYIAKYHFPSLIIMHRSVLGTYQCNNNNMIYAGWQFIHDNAVYPTSNYGNQPFKYFPKFCRLSPCIYITHFTV